MGVLADRYSLLGFFYGQKMIYKSKEERRKIESDLMRMVEYDESSPSCLIWKFRSGSRGIPGSFAGYLSRSQSGNYYVVGYKEIGFKCHRIIWSIFNGPSEKMIDHIDGNTQNNKISNLREATHSQNLMNRKINKNNLHGIKGISFCKSKNKWVGQVMKDKKNHRIYGENLDEIKDWVANKRIELHCDFSRFI